MGAKMADTGYDFDTIIDRHNTNSIAFFNIPINQNADLALSSLFDTLVEIFYSRLYPSIPSATDPSQATVVNIQATENGQGLANNSVWALTEDKWGRMWFSTLGGGLQMLDPKTGKFTTWDSKNSVVAGELAELEQERLADGGLGLLLFAGEPRDP